MKMICQNRQYKWICKKFKIICENSLKYLDKDRYFAVVIGDVYKKIVKFYLWDFIVWIW